MTDIPSDAELTAYFFGFTDMPNESDRVGKVKRFNGDPSVDVVLYTDGEPDAFALFIHEELVLSAQHFPFFMMQVRVGLGHRMRVIAQTN